MANLLEDLLKGVVRHSSPPAPQPALAPKQDPLKSFLGSALKNANQNQQALKDKVPFLEPLGQELKSGVHKVSSVLDQGIRNAATNVKDAVTGKLKVSPSDIGTGTYKTVSGIGKLAQGFNQGVAQLGKSLLTIAPGSGEELTHLGGNPNLRAFLASVKGGDDTPTIQNIYTKATKHAEDLGATQTQAKVFGGSFAIGAIFADNPLFGPEGAGLRVSSRAAGLIAKADDAVKVAAHLVEDGVEREVAEKIAPILVHTDTPKGVLTAIEEVNNGTRNFQSVLDGTEKERGFITSVKEQLPELETRVAGQYIPRDTDALALRATKRITDDVAEAEKIAARGTDDEAVATAVQLLKHYTDQADRLTDQAAKNALYDKAAAIANDMAIKLTAQGRAVQAASILGRLTPEGQVRFAAREIQKFNEANPGNKIPELTGEQVEQITAKVKAVSEMPDGIGKARAFKETQDFIADLVPTLTYKKIISVWKAGLLTGIKTSGINTFSNLFHGISEVVKDIPAVAVDKFASLFTGKRTIGLTARGTLKGGGEGVKKGWDYFKTGFDERYAREGLDMGRVNFGTSKVAKAIQAYEETVFRLIGAEDQPFYYAAKARSLYSQAIAESKNAKLKRPERKAFIQHLIENPTDEMLTNATHDAEVAVFQNSTALGRVARKIQQDVPGGEIIVPFGRTPAAVAMQMFHYTPVGTVAEIVKQVRAGRFSQRSFSQAVGRGVTGTGAMYLGYELWKQGKISLGYPTDPTEQQEWKSEGRQENSIKINGKWRQVGSLGPLGTELVIGGYLANGFEKTGSVVEAVIQASIGGLTTLEQSTFLQGISQFIDAIKDPERSAGSLFQGLIASVIPTIVGDVARSTDPYERDTKLGGDFLNRTRARIPGLREKSLQPQTDSYGNRIATPGFLTAMADPSRPTKETDDPVIQEVARLTHAGEKPNSQLLGGKKGYSSLTPAQNTALRLRGGQILRGKLAGLMATEEYKALDDAEKAKAIKDFSKKATDVARAEVTLQLTEGLSGDELASELGKLKGSGLLNRDVYRVYQDMR